MKQKELSFSPPLLQHIQFCNTSISILRLDTIHPQISGNKYFKLKYNLQQALLQGKQAILTFGGAYSNHIAATAAAGHVLGIKTIGIIRGEEVKNLVDLNPTLAKAKSLGMQLDFISRTAYREKNGERFLTQIKKEYGNVYILPEGGSNKYAVKGTEEICNKTSTQYDIICCAVGTGGTLAGIINASQSHQQILGFSAVNANLASQINQWTTKTNYQLITDYHFGGFAKTNTALLNFVNDFYANYQIPLDYLYTAKLFWGLQDLLLHKKISGKILAIHTGGLQGNKGFEKKLSL